MDSKQQYPLQVTETARIFTITLVGGRTEAIKRDSLGAMAMYNQRARNLYASLDSAVRLDGTCTVLRGDLQSAIKLAD